MKVSEKQPHLESDDQMGLEESQEEGAFREEALLALQELHQVDQASSLQLLVEAVHPF